MAVVPDLVGWPRDQRDNLLRWGGSHFRRPRPAEQARAEVMPGALQMLRFARRVVRERSVHRGQPRPRRAARRGRGQAVARRMRAADDRLHRPVAGHHHQRHLQRAVPVRHPPRAVAAPQRRSVPDPQRGQRGHPLRVSAAGVLPKRALRHRDRRRRHSGRRAGAGHLRLGQPRRTRVGRPRHLRHPPRRHPPARLRPGRARLRRPGPGPAGDARDAARPASSASTASS